MTPTATYAYDVAPQNSRGNSLSSTRRWSWHAPKLKMSKKAYRHKVSLVVSQMSLPGNWQK
ncbi:hypothetical protein QQP08_020869 [Theobroma cacao]|nr:hypothetical protein QQP08_020869 [Theobroma cacao]